MKINKLTCTYLLLSGFKLLAITDRNILNCFCKKSKITKRRIGNTCFQVTFYIVSSKVYNFILNVIAVSVCKK